MPIYQYKCADCEHQLEALQKMTDPKLVDCPACGAASLVKQVTAAAFKLKGTGWYETDFKNSGKPKAPAKSTEKSDSESKSSDAASDVKGSTGVENSSSATSSDAASA